MKIKMCLLPIVGFVMMTAATPQIYAQAPHSEMRLWSGDAPGALGKTPDDIPTLTPYLLEVGKTPSAAMLVMPGGGYGGVVMDHEGSAYALWLNHHGIVAFVLRYRLGSPMDSGPAVLATWAGICHNGKVISLRPDWAKSQSP